MTQLVSQTPTKSAMMQSRRFLALAFPFLAADLFHQRQQADAAQALSHGASPAKVGAAGADAPLVFTARQGGAFRLVALDAAALVLGLVPGMALADARARLPGLLAVPHDPTGEAALLDRLAEACLRYTPLVALAPPDGLMLDMTGCAHLFGGEQGLAADAARAMQRRGLRVRLGRADTPEAALALARYGAMDEASDEAMAIRHLPIAALGQSEDALHGLRRAGFTTLGDLADLPSASLAARFGGGLVDALDRLLGRVDSRLTPRRAPPPIWTARRFAEPVVRTEAVLAALDNLLAEACARLAERHQGGRRFALRLDRSDGAVRILAVETGAPVRDPALVARLIAERIDALRDPLDPGFGFDMLRLAVPVVEALAPQQAGLMGERDRTSELTALLDRLGARLGAGRFCRIVPQDSHIPERASQLVPYVGATAPAWALPLAGEPPLRPLTLFDPPERIAVLAAVPDGPPRSFRWRGRAYQVAAQEGPERIAAEWWRRRDGHAGNPGRTRDYYRLEDVAGQRFWVFRHGLYERESARPDWYLHGLFA